MYTFNYNSNQHGSAVVFVNYLNAPELQKVYLRDNRGNLHRVASQHLNVPANGWFTCTNAEAVSAYRKLNRVANRVGRYCWVAVTLPDRPVKRYHGYVASYADVLRFKRKLRLRHNLAGTTFKVSTQFICG